MLIEPVDLWLYVQKQKKKNRKLSNCSINLVNIDSYPRAPMKLTFYLNSIDNCLKSKKK